MNKFTKNDLKACQTDLRKWSGIRMTLTQIAALLAIDTYASRFLAKDFATGHPSPKWGIDTWSHLSVFMPRDYLFDQVAHVFVGPKAHWPLNGDGDEVGQKFFRKLSVALDKKGVKHDFWD
jgi:hypothetical protein